MVLWIYIECVILAAVKLYHLLTILLLSTFDGNVYGRISDVNSVNVQRVRMSPHAQNKSSLVSTAGKCQALMVNVLYWKHNLPYQRDHNFVR